ncbi:BZ3500_MvSof-1268-A1-R1_Chr9g10752 [Microbotryum saponariae]|uniref:BZ3500_MvSof-1268-A1-R1_Chr9g10752 protein n=1 Tax=Microbotryum saponariae TaxID=289078 RepID=A0A2X0L7Q0_9BASI|nr:BZ3501_MvSof-1269-A2-R1_Chr9g10500 [Microbotryum saponariae]SDA00628.1 BZ3500_MvSof-1268-A1-R1_Chr9g10752 [Microbotryum saponariae]
MKEQKQHIAAMAAKVEASRADLRSIGQRAMAFGKTEARVAADKRGQSRRFTLAVCRPFRRVTPRPPVIHPAAPMPDPALSRSTSSNARTSRSSPASHGSFPAEAMQSMPTSKEESRKDKGGQMFAS